MSLGGFTSSVQITKLYIRGGFTDRGEPLVGAEMKFEGKLLVFHYGDLRERLTRQAKTSVEVQIEFTDTQEVAWGTEDEDKPYIGTIRLFDYSTEEYIDTKIDPIDIELGVIDTEIDVIVSITLPISMFQQVALMEGKNIKFETIHNLIQNATEDQKQQHIVAFVKQAYFETKKDLELEREKKRWSFWQR